MTDSGRGILGNPDATPKEVERAMQHAVRLALIEHCRRGESVVVRDPDTDETITLGPDQLAETLGVDPRLDPSGALIEMQERPEDDPRTPLIAAQTPSTS